jgi:m7GpppX diphosphatase
VLFRSQWIYNIIDGAAEQSDIIYMDEDIIIIPTYTWANSDVEKLHVLAIVKDKNLRTIRDLNQSHIELLKKIKNIGLAIISSNYSIEIDEINIYFHYEPSTYQLHAHFTNLLNNDFKNSVECSHHIDNVIFNLSLNSDYYKLINMVKRL